MITLVIGGQYGSEGKGSVVSWLSRHQSFDLVIRTGAPNAGHTFKMVDSTIVKMRQLPCSWAFQETPIYIPAGAVINTRVLHEELTMIREKGHKVNLSISPRASIIQPDDVNAEVAISTGTTGEGVGACRASKLMRQATLAQDLFQAKSFMDSQWFVHHVLQDCRKHILIESTQGYGLSLDGDAYPFVTSTNIDTYRILSDAEVPFGVHKIDVWVVLRTYPIRIAGKSGWLFNETSWDELRERHGSHIPDEQTTVTKKLRRVGEFNQSQAKDAIDRCGANNVVLTFMDYIFPDIGKSGVTSEIHHWLTHLEGLLCRQVDFLGIGIGEIIPRLYLDDKAKAALKEMRQRG